MKEGMSEGGREGGENMCSFHFNFYSIEICDILEFALGSIWVILFLDKIEHPSERTLMGQISSHN